MKKRAHQRRLGARFLWLDSVVMSQINLQMYVFVAYRKLDIRTIDKAYEPLFPSASGVYFGYMHMAYGKFMKHRNPCFFQRKACKQRTRSDLLRHLVTL